ncbi:MAG: flagellar hook basal-body protein [Sedimentisphaerales bacterium]|nr:flagellar hook basal-body protein [Sedimentisphaerales bacterium]
MVNSTGPLGSSIDALMKEYQTITNNLANVSTTGYKRQINTFSRHLLDKLADAPASDPPVAELVTKGGLDFSQGTLLATQRTLDVAIEGKGFLVVETPEGPLYTRNGVLQINAQGNLVDLQGRIVAGAEGLIIIPPNVNEQDITISEEGVVSMGQAQFGRLRIVDFGADENQLVPVGFNSYKAPDNLQSAVATNASVKQGFRESSNVQLMEEMVDLMTVARMYETNMGLMQRRRELTRTIMGIANG